ncbi:NADH:flavin oxidoreductase/NADH oxidase [Guyanagaster necrorhizus]|uniref:NADH:flavin oxidoreductase/NADH oxidase n=1 Tax=Guyanagaster necrorhizus TaxID=856835 RepID=A0A9P8B0K4_9AGAR|nr:NADH:flavin oxidoreductase/NADH oxidase [Guyanagaster necrorhizus MCA 3950]KAG7453217.1 NADH:flavin oxidoreductase/NADH oxidase [Guyanagaster necrorhizus MCA 3950]
MTMAPKLFQPTNVGPISLNHRVVLAPLTRFRASKAHIPHVRIVKEYYEQRAHTPGTLLITEAMCIAERAGGYDNVPGIWNQDQIDAWKEITSAVHAKGSYMFCQLWALGRAADPKILASEGLPYVSASDVGLSHEAVAPRPLTVEEIREYVELYAQAARNAISAGFDGVEIHGANGYLLDQFTQDVTNKRTDVYGGRISNRVRFPLEVVDAVASAIGPERVGYRISPWNNSNGMTMVDPKPTFGFLASQLKVRQPRLAYLHVVEPRMVGLYGRKEEDIGVHEENDFIRRVWSPKALISAGGYSRESAIDTAENKGDLIGFGRHFIANPDLVYRLERDIALNA